MTWLASPAAVRCIYSPTAASGVYQPGTNLLLLLLGKYFFSMARLPLPLCLLICFVFGSAAELGSRIGQQSFPGAGWAAGGRQGAAREGTEGAQGVSPGVGLCLLLVGGGRGTRAWGWSRRRPSLEMHRSGELLCPSRLDVAHFCRITSANVTSRFPVSLGVNGQVAGQPKGFLESYPSREDGVGLR